MCPQVAVRCALEVAIAVQPAHAYAPALSSGATRALMRFVAEYVVIQRMAAYPRRMLGGLQLLVVEDDDDTREVLSTCLESRGAIVRGADSGERAISIATSWRPDILLIDLVLPDLDGVSLLHSLRRLKEPCTAPAIAVTGMGSLNDRAITLAGGFAKHLTKPARLRDIVSAVHAVRPGPSTRTSGKLRATLEALNARSDCRYTSVLRFVDDGTLSSVWTVDREAPEMDPFPTNLPVEASYCVFVRANGSPCVIANANTDPRAVDHPKRASLPRYIGVPILDARGALFGTLCSYDPKPAPVDQAVVDDHVNTAAMLSLTIADWFDSVGNR